MASRASTRQRKAPASSDGKSSKETGGVTASRGRPKDAKTATVAPVATKKRAPPGDSGNEVAPRTRPSKRAKPNEIPKTKPKPTKKAKIAAGVSTTAKHGSINQAPTEPLGVFVFGSGECGELGLGPKRKAALRPRLNPYLDPSEPSGHSVVQISCGGMHTLALTASNKILTWGVNDNFALGRATEWDGGLRDVDAGSDDDEDEELNPFESVPQEIPSEYFPPSTRFVQVAAGDSCSFALTDAGHVFGWGTFLQWKHNREAGETCPHPRPGEHHPEYHKPRICLRPTAVPALGPVSHVACGTDHTVFVSQDGTAFASGLGSVGQLGLGSEEDVEVAQQIGAKSIKDEKISWAGAGGQFSVLAAARKSGRQR